MILSSIRHSGTGRDCLCLQPKRFLFRLESAQGDLSAAVLHAQDKYIPLQRADTRVCVPMHVTASDGIWDYWEAELSFDVICLRYWFELTDRQGNTVYLSNHHFTDVPPQDVNDMFDCPQNLRQEERFVVPQWAAHQVVYQVFPSRFAASHPVPDKIWYKAPVTPWDDLHGDLRGVIDHLDHLRELGVDVLYMTPLFRSDSCHKYDTIDYYTVDPSFGTKEDLKELVDKAHAMGLRVILDGVFNHTSPEFFAFADIRRHGRASRYLDWYFIDSFPLRANWGEKPSFKTFAYYGGMPKLNLRNPQVTRYILNVVLYWLRECHIDGWRLDVGDEIGHAFWQTFRSHVKAEFPDALIIGQVWHPAEDFLQGNEWDTVMNYPFRQSVLGLAADGTMKPSQFVHSLSSLRGRLHPAVQPLLWNLIGSHDTPRILNMCGGDKQKMKLAAALQLLLPGMPMLYYGDEFAMEGGQDPDCRRGMLWDPARQDRDMFTFFRQLIRIRKSHPDILRDDVAVTADDDAGLLIRRAADCTVVFHTVCGELPLPEYAGCTDLLTGAAFDGIARPCGVYVFAPQ